MLRNPVTSSQIASVGYDPTTRTLELEFTPSRSTPSAPGSVYQYYEVPENVHRELIGAPSIGSYFIKNLKRGPYRYKKIEPEQTTA